MEAPEAYRMALLGLADGEGVVEARVRRGRGQHVHALEALARQWLGEQVPEQFVDMAVALVGQTLVSIGEAGVRMMLAAPETWTPQTLGTVMGRLASGGFEALVERYLDASVTRRPPVAEATTRGSLP
jgi:predicted ArsR family transcriptional regulator